MCIHDLSLERTTNVEEVFPDRSSTDPAGGTARRWLVADFTLAEIKKLDAGSWFDCEVRRRADPDLPGGDRCWCAGKPAFTRSSRTRRSIATRGVNPEVLLADVLARNKLIGDATTPVFIQSFDEVTIKALSRIAAEDAPRLAGRAA